MESVAGRRAVRGVALVASALGVGASFVGVAAPSLRLASATAVSRPVCGSPRGETLLATRRVRIYVIAAPEGEAPRLYACLVKPPRLWAMPRWSVRHRGVAQSKPLAIHASWIAFERDTSGIDTLSVDIVAKNLRTGESTHCHVGGRIAPAPRPSLTAIAVNGRGSIAWIGRTRLEPSFGRGPVVRAVGACDSSGGRVLDSGPGIDLHSLVLGGASLTWTDAGETRTAALH